MLAENSRIEYRGSSIESRGSRIEVRGTVNLLLSSTVNAVHLVSNNIAFVLLLSTKGPAKPKTYYIAHEILTTERTFVDALKLVFEVGEKIIRSMM